MKQKRLTLTLSIAATLVLLTTLSYANFFSARYRNSFIPRIKDEYMSINPARWVVGLGLGLDFLLFSNNTQYLSPLAFTPGFPPNSPDIFALGGANSGSIINLSVGYQLEFDNLYIKYLQLFAEFDNFAQVTAGGQRDAFSNPNPFWFSSYNFNVDRHAFLVGGKIDLGKWTQKWFPYLEMGFGISNNTFSDFNNANAQTIVAINPFPNQTTSSFSYILGLGLDFPFRNNWEFSAGYRFGYWGDLKSGILTQAPGGAGSLEAPIHIMHHIYSNQAIVKMSYLF